MSPERRYRLLLLSYPRSYRVERAEEMLDVLLAADRPGTWSAVSEAASLVGHGLAQRARQPSTVGTAPRRWDSRERRCCACWGSWALGSCWRPGSPCCSVGTA